MAFFYPKLRTLLYTIYKSFTDDKGYDISKWTFDSLANKYFYFSRPEQLNDPLDCRIFNEYEAEDKEIQDWIDRKPSRKKIDLELIRTQLNTGKLQKVMEEHARKDEQYFHVLSLTDSWNNNHMWERYAHQYEGICIGYVSTYYDHLGCNCIKVKAHSADVQLLENPFFGVKQTAYFDLQEVKYDNDGKYKYNVFKSYSDYNKIAICYALLHKTEKWSKEKEYRKIIMETPHHNCTPTDLRVFYPDTVLSEICFGYKCDLKIKKQIFDCIKKNYSNWEDIHFYNVQQVQSDGGLGREKISFPD